ncbi:hypothetical protein V1514DRAFT_323352 [Lipomyces japonicus]|uniref:uncharacterized protein n=1 Tax=Lipomyces japonicus TaxID=56871 RepID=UPI0034CE5CA7
MRVNYGGKLDQQAKIGFTDGYVTSEPAVEDNPLKLIESDEAANESKNENESNQALEIEAADGKIREYTVHEEEQEEPEKSQSNETSKTDAQQADEEETVVKDEVENLKKDSESGGNDAVVCDGHDGHAEVEKLNDYGFKTEKNTIVDSNSAAEPESIEPEHDISQAEVAEVAEPEITELEFVNTQSVGSITEEYQNDETEPDNKQFDEPSVEQELADFNTEEYQNEEIETKSETEQLDESSAEPDLARLNPEEFQNKELDAKQFDEPLTQSEFVKSDDEEFNNMRPEIESETKQFDKPSTDLDSVESHAEEEFENEEPETESKQLDEPCTGESDNLIRTTEDGQIRESEKPNVVEVSKEPVEENLNDEPEIIEHSDTISYTDVQRKPDSTAASEIDNHEDRDTEEHASEQEE